MNFRLAISGRNCIVNPRRDDTPPVPLVSAGGGGGARRARACSVTVVHRRERTASRFTPLLVIKHIKRNVIPFRRDEEAGDLWEVTEKPWWPLDEDAEEDFEDTVRAFPSHSVEGRRNSRSSRFLSESRGIESGIFYWGL